MLNDWVFLFSVGSAVVNGHLPFIMGQLNQRREERFNDRSNDAYLDMVNINLSVEYAVSVSKIIIYILHFDIQCAECGHFLSFGQRVSPCS